MKRPVLILSFLAGVNVVAGAQEAWTPWVGISAGMGIGAMSQPSVVDYVNSASQLSSSQKISEFVSVTEFTVTPEVKVAEDWSVGIDYMYRIKSLSVNGTGGQSQYQLSSHHVGFVGHYLIEGEGYLVRVGGGASLVSGTFSQALFGSPLFSDFFARGGSIKIDAIADTKFDDQFYGMIGADMRWVFGQTFHNGSREARVGSLKAGLSSFTLGLKLGVTIRF